MRLTFGANCEPVRAHYYRVKDVVYVLDNPIDIKLGVLVEEDATEDAWLS